MNLNLNRPAHAHTVPRTLALASCGLILIACNTTYDVGDDAVKGGTGGTAGPGGEGGLAGSGGRGVPSGGPFPFACDRWGQGGKLDIPVTRLVRELPVRLWLDNSPEAFAAVAAMFDSYQGHEGDLFCIVLHVLEDFRAQKAMKAFYQQWLGTRTAMPKDPIKFPGFDAARIAGLAEKTVGFAVDATLNPTRRYSDLFTAQRPMEFSPDWGTRLPDEKALSRYAAGLLVEPGVLSLHGTTDVSPMARASWVLKTLICQELPPPPPDVPPLDFSMGDPSESYRQRFLRGTNADPACSSCHRLMDAPGLALDEFDAVGRLQPVDRLGQPFSDLEPLAWTIPAAPGPGGDWKFSSLGELGRLLVTGAIRPVAASCFARHWVNFLSGGAAEWPSDSKEVASIVAALDTGDRIPHLIAQTWVLLARTGHLVF